MSTSTHGPQVVAPTTYVTGGAISRGLAVKRGADLNTVVAGTANSANLGIAYDDQQTTGMTIPVVHRPGETPLGRSGAAFALDAFLASDSAGRLVTATTGQLAIARAREAATAADQLVTVEIVPTGTLAP